MSEVTDFIAAVVAIAKDPKAWEKRLGDADDIAKQLAELRKTKKDADAAAERASADKSTAQYDRAQADKAVRDGAQQASANNRRETELNAREKALTERESRLAQEHAARNAEIERLEADLEIREKIAAKKLHDAQALLADYDKAKHDAALKLAS